MKYKIKLLNGKLSRITFFNIPLFEYGKKDREKFFSFLINKKIKQNKNENVFYLKQNKYTDLALLYLQHWIDIIPYNSKIFLIVDDKKVLQKIIENIKFKNENIYFIKSIRNRYLKNFCKKAGIDSRWQNTALAHLTTFYHSQKNNIKTYWNIDSDDTLICLEDNKASFCLENIAKYAIENNIDLFSLDFYWSRGAGLYRHWSFGITHSINNQKLKKILYLVKKDWFNMFKDITPCNLDWYMNYIKALDKDIKVNSFSINNLLFLHDTAFFRAGWLSFMQFKKDKIEYPIFSKFYQHNEMGIGYIPIDKDVIKFDFNINEDEGLNYIYDKYVNKNIYYTFLYQDK